MVSQTLLVPIGPGLVAATQWTGEIGREVEQFVMIWVTYTATWWHVMSWPVLLSKAMSESQPYSSLGLCWCPMIMPMSIVWAPTWGHVDIWGSCCHWRHIDPSGPWWHSGLHCRQGPCLSLWLYCSLSLCWWLWSMLLVGAIGELALLASSLLER